MKYCKIVQLILIIVDKTSTGVIFVNGRPIQIKVIFAMFFIHLAGAPIERVPWVPRSPFILRKTWKNQNIWIKIPIKVWGRKNRTCSTIGHSNKIHNFSLILMKLGENVHLKWWSILPSFMMIGLKLWIFY